MDFVSLHGHTSFSFGDGHGTPEEHVKRVKELGMSALAVTEHGNVSSHVQLEKACKKHGIKPIFGVEAYVAPPNEKHKFHQTILAMTQQGYRQLNELVTRSYHEGFYFKPTMHPEWLLDRKLTSDLIVFSGCADSWLSCTLAGGKSVTDVPRLDNLANPTEADKQMYLSRYPLGVELAKRFQECYSDRYYIELQPFSFYMRTRVLNSMNVRIGKELGIPLVATSDVHYPLPSDWETQVYLNAIAWNQTPSKLTERRNYERDPQAYPRSEKELYSRLVAAAVPPAVAREAIMITPRIAERCSVTLPKNDPIRFQTGWTDEQAEVRLIKELQNGLLRRVSQSETFTTHYKENKQAYINRIKKEFAVIKEKGFCDYFLINQDVINWAKKEGIVVGPARGSAAGSLVCYLLGITEINPMMFPQMLFERFLDPGREDAPDIDTDYEDAKRDKVFEYARSRYGNENVGNIGNFSRYRGKMAIKDVARVSGVRIDVADKYNSYIEQLPFGDPREFETAKIAAENFEEAQAIITAHPGLEKAFEIEGDMKTLSIHAAGMVLSNKPIKETCALYHSTKSSGVDTEVIAFDKRDAAYLNLLKLDCLGLSTLTLISKAIEGAPDFTIDDLYNLPLDNVTVLKSFASDDLNGIFQFEGRSTRAIVNQLFWDRPDAYPDINQLADINALSRPGALSSGMTAEYIRVARGAEPRSYHPVVDKILGSTNGCLVYQEQVMQIGKEFGGLSDHEIGRLRKIIGSKQSGGAFDEFKAKFVSGAKEQWGASETLALEIWDYMAASSGYLFNVAHAVSYAVIAYWTMYLKRNYPASFYAGALTIASQKGKVKGKIDPVRPILLDAKAHNIDILPPHPAYSGYTWSALERSVRAGFLQLPKVGPKIAKAMRDALNSSPDVASWERYMYEVKGFGKKTVEAIHTWLDDNVDPFGVEFDENLYQIVTEKINNWELDLPALTLDSKNLNAQLGNQLVTTILRVEGLKRIFVDTDGMDSPHLNLKAKLTCITSKGKEVAVNISRYQYRSLAKELKYYDDSKEFLIHVTGTTSFEYGLAIQGKDLTLVQLN